MTEETKELVLFNADEISPQLLFEGETLGNMLEDIAVQARSVIRDISTPAGRKNIASLAAKIARTKTTIDGFGKALVSDWKTKSKAVDIERKQAREFLDALKVEIRDPLTEYENKEKQRISDHEFYISTIQGACESTDGLSVEKLEKRIILADKAYDRKWEEFSKRANEIKDAAVLKLNNLINIQKKRDAEKAELQRLQKAEKERLQKERDEKLKQEASDKAQAEAEKKAEVERQKLQDEKDEADRKLKQAAIDAEKAEMKAEMEKQEAIEAERERVAKENAAKEKAELKHANNKRNIEKVRREVNEDLAKFLIECLKLDGKVLSSINLDVLSLQLVDFIDAGNVRHLEINYTN
ncbi:MAG: hypothetical protein DRQ46_00055 [Gammaproteobacteria bacterium]|nr:MAG: hypothetical protein DRQ46_00055 [Gammaproteobacteria bacterium]